MRQLESAAGVRMTAFPQPGLTRWQTAFLFLVGTLASTIRLKIAGVQYMELLYFFQIALLLLAFHAQGYRLRMLRPLYRLGVCYFLFGMTALLLSIAALRFDFYYPQADEGLLRRPVWITAVRLIELTGNSSMMLYLAEIFRLHAGALRYCLRIYFWAGVASAGFALVSYPLAQAGHDFGAYLSIGVRLRGFYNEGGPYGIYLVSVFVAGLALMAMGWEPKIRVVACFGFLAAALAGSQSKASVAVVLMLCGAYFLMASSLRRQLVTATVAVVAVAIAGQTIDLGRSFRIYQQAGAAYERASLIHRGDTNFVEGRIAGAFIVPKMIAAHPLTGIGWGNYGILRNAPEYRGASAWSDYADDPGLGMLGTTADFGIPLQLFLLACLLLPFFYARSVSAPNFVKIMALVQPVAHLAGAQLNLTYPWVVSACAMGLAYSGLRDGRWDREQARGEPAALA
jgi:hypothetical protein